MKRLAYSALPLGFQHRWIAVVLTILAMLSFGSLTQAEETGRVSVVEVTGKKVGETLEVRVKGDGGLTYTSYELPNPARIVVDLANAYLQPTAVVNFPGDGNIKLQTKEITDAQPQILRLEFILEKYLTTL